MHSIFYKMLAIISKLILKLFGWKEAGDFPEGDKFVVLVVPHTSMFDFVWGRVYYYSIKKSVKFMIKDKYFFFPLGIFLRAIGAIPVVLNRKIGMVEQMVGEFNKRDKLLLTIAPEATRERVNRWRKGFYHIAQQADVPLVLAYVDYKKKELGATKSFNLSGDEKKDKEEIRKFYENISAKHPEKYNKDKI